MDLNAYIALLTEAFAQAKADPSGRLMSGLNDAFLYSEPFRLALASASAKTLASALTPPAAGAAATDADLPADPAALRTMLTTLIDERIRAAMAVKPEGSEVEIMLGDAVSQLMTDMAEIKQVVDAMKTSAPAAASVIEEKVKALDAAVVKVAADAKLAKDHAATATAMATSAKDSADAFKVAEAAKLAHDAADADAKELAEVRALGKRFGMRDAADTADKATIAAHLRSKHTGGVRDSDSDVAVIAVARALAARPGGIVATDSKSTGAPFPGPIGLGT